MTATEPDGVARRPIATFRLTRWVAIQWLVVSAVGFFGFAYCFGHVLAAIRGVSLEPIVVTATSPPAVLAWLVAALGLLALVVVPHELLHGAVVARYGGSPSYGVGVSHFLLPHAYAETRGTSYTRNQLLAALLAPVGVITAVGLLAMGLYPTPLLVLPLAANAAGSIGDLWTAAVLCQYPADVRVTALPDDAKGIAIYDASGSVRSSDSARASRTGSSDSIGRLPGTTTLSAVATGAVGTLAASVVALLGLLFHSLAFGTGSLVVDPGGWLLFRHELQSGGVVHIEIGGRRFAGLALAGGVAWALLRGAWRALE